MNGNFIALDGAHRYLVFANNPSDPVHLRSGINLPFRDFSSPIISLLTVCASIFIPLLSFSSFVWLCRGNWAIWWCRLGVTHPWRFPCFAHTVKLFPRGHLELSRCAVFVFFSCFFFNATTQTRSVAVWDVTACKKKEKRRKKGGKANGKHVCVLRHASWCLHS